MCVSVSVLAVHILYCVVDQSDVVIRVHVSHVTNLCCAPYKQPVLSQCGMSGTYLCLCLFVYARAAFRGEVCNVRVCICEGVHV